MHLRSAPRHAAVLAASLSVGVVAQSSCSPQMFWVNYLNTPDQAAISWTTSCSSVTTVQYGTTPSMGTQAFGNSSQYTFMDGAYTSPFLHHTPLSGLPLATTIYYQVGGGASGWSSVMNFTTHPGVGPAVPLRFAVVGDLGQTTNSVDTVAHIAASPNTFNALIHAGDLSYADSDEPRWDSWQLMVQGVAQSLPWMTVVGNHEIEVDLNLQTFEAYKARFFMPYINYGTPQQSKQLFYGFTLGSVHFIMLSSYSDYSNSSVQTAWLTSELASVDRTVTPWVIVVLHAPWYNTNTAHQGEGEAMREAYEATLFAAGVDLVFAGHVHAYERSYRTFNNARNAAGPYFITIGDGGNREGLADKWISPQAATSAFRQASYGHGEMEVLNATHMHWTWHQNPDLEPTIADDLWIIKGQSWELEHAQQHTGVTSRPQFRRA